MPRQFALTKAASTDGGNAQSTSIHTDVGNFTLAPVPITVDEAR